MAYEFDLPLIGTMAHQWLMVHQQLGRLRESQNAALENWVREYRGRLGIALTDCISTDFFLKDFDLYFAKLYDGLRQDSGDPIVWADKVLGRYQELGIDPRTKDLMFSDGLNFEKVPADPASYSRQGQIRFLAWAPAWPAMSTGLNR
nr:hypothetical protein GCM10020185_33400 [Pseudomonas brassicacearum subsp. brassicacearum]